MGAIEEFERKEAAFSDRSVFTDHVTQFSRDAFKMRIIRIIEERIMV
jgi:hypothetical protein